MAECGHKNEDFPIVKSADDTGLRGLIFNDDSSYYRQEIDNLVAWCNVII